MASIEKLNQTIQDQKDSITQLETDVTALINAHSTCPTSEQVQAAAASVRATLDTITGLSSQVKAAIARDAQPEKAAV